MKHVLGYSVEFIGALFCGLLWLWTGGKLWALAACLFVVLFACEGGSQH